MSGLMGFMGAMSLVEAYRLYQLREQQQLHKHPLFQIARSQVTNRHDGMGMVATFNQEGIDDPQDYDNPQVAPCCCCPWLKSGEFQRSSQGDLLSDDETANHELAILNALSPEERAARRAERDQFLRNVEARR